jgi:hypothetical protein
MPWDLVKTFEAKDLLLELTANGNGDYSVRFKTKLGDGRTVSAINMITYSQDEGEKPGTTSSAHVESPFDSIRNLLALAELEANQIEKAWWEKEQERKAREPKKKAKNRAPRPDGSAIEKAKQRAVPSYGRK